MRPEDCVKRGGGLDRRIASQQTLKAAAGHRGSVGQLSWRLCRELVQAATRGFEGGAAVNKRAIARELETTPGVLERMMRPSDDLQFRADHLIKLLSCEMVPERARHQAMAAIARECGGVFVPDADVAATAAAITAATLKLSGDAGKVAQVVSQATDPASDGGVKVTSREAEEITGAATDAQMAAGQVVRAASV